MALNHAKKKTEHARNLKTYAENATNNVLISLFSATLISPPITRIQFNYGFVKKKAGSKVGFLG